MNSMKIKLKNLAAVCAISLFVTPSLAMAKTNSYDWIVRARALHVKTDVRSSVSTIGGHIGTSSDQTPELDFTRFITPNIAAELILATTHHDIYIKDSAVPNDKIGSVNLLPPTLTLQYHFMPEATFRPYAGAGLNYTFFFNNKPNGVATNLKYQNHLGYALQAGFDYMIDERFSVNFDVKKVFLKTNVRVNGLYTAKVNLDPWIVGVGMGYRF